MSVSFNSRFVTKKFLFSLIFIFFIFLLVFLILDGYFELKRDLKIYNADAKDIINQRINSLLSETDPLPESLKENLLFISELSSFKKFINEGDSNLNDLEEDFLSLLTQNDIYYQIIFLVDSEGYYLSNPDADKEFAFSFGNNYNFYNDYPEISKETLTDFKIRDFESKDLVFSFRHIYSNNYSLILISISDKDEINKISSQLRMEYFIFLFFSCFIVFMILIFIFILTFRFNNGDIRRNKK